MLTSHGMSTNMKTTISNKYLGKLVNKRWEAVREYFYRHNLNKDNPEHVKAYLLKIWGK